MPTVTAALSCPHTIDVSWPQHQLATGTTVLRGLASSKGFVLPNEASVGRQ